MFIPIDFIVHYHSEKLGIVNSIHLSPIYINVIDSVSRTRNIAKCPIVQVFLIFSEKSQQLKIKVKVFVFQYLNYVPFFCNYFRQIKILVPSPCIIGKMVCETALKSFIQIRNNKGPNIDRCGTPQVIFVRTELVSPILTVSFL